MMQVQQTHIQAMIRFGTDAHRQGWVAAGSGNFSTRIDEAHLSITASGRHKGYLQAEDFLVVDMQGQPLESTLKPSDETLLHCQIYARHAQAGSVLHTHSPAATVLSMSGQTEWWFEGYELLKAFPGLETHDTNLVLSVYPNDQDIVRLAAHVDQNMTDDCCAYLIAGHGLYTWASDVTSAWRQTEALEHLFQCELIKRSSGL